MFICRYSYFWNFPRARHQWAPESALINFKEFYRTNDIKPTVEPPLHTKRIIFISNFFSICFYTNTQILRLISLSSFSFQRSFFYLFIYLFNLIAQRICFILSPYGLCDDVTHGVVCGTYIE